MKTKFLFLSVFFASLMLFLSSCDSDPKMDAVPPVFSEMTLTPSAPNAGDSVTVVVGYAKNGKNWYKAKYSWTLAGPNKYEDKGSGAVLGSGTKPTFKFKVPEGVSGTYTLTFKPGYVSASSLFPVGNYGAPETSTTIEKGTITFHVK